MDTPASSTTATTAQLIDANGDFVGNLPVTDSETSITNYRTVAVVGCQSGGKSTLLNYVFGTRFPVLDAPKLGRCRTTLGIWAAVAPTAHNAHASTSSTSTPSVSPSLSDARYVVLDVEGTDSRERGEGAKTFENRTTLFTLALSDVVLVNMWAHDLGRHSAANYDLFETVFAHAIALRRQKLFTNPVKVLIVVRDHDGESSLTDIKRVLMGDLLNIWMDLDAAEVSFEDVFNVDVIALPHKNYAEESFKQGVIQLSQHLNRQLFSKGSDKKKNNNLNASLAPLGGFDALAQQVWDSVSNCTAGADGFGLDLPKQAALAAYYKCGEIAHSLVAYTGDIGKELQTLRVDVETSWQSPLQDCSKRMKDIAEQAFAKYDEKTAGYANAGYGESQVKGEVLKSVHERRRELGGELVKHVEEIRERFLSVCWDFCFNGFEDEFRPLLGGTRGFERSARRMAQTYVRKYKAYVRDGQLPSCLKAYVAVARAQEEGQNENNASEERNESRDANDSEQQTVDDEVDLDDDDDDLQVVEMDLTVNDDDDNENNEDGEVERRRNRVEEDRREDGDEFGVERFKKELLAKIEERKRMGELMLPGGGMGPVEPKREKWWKGILMRGLILLINYLQATQGHRAALKLQRQQEKEFPPSPTF